VLSQRRHQAKWVSTFNVICLTGHLRPRRRQLRRCVSNLSSFLEVCDLCIERTSVSRPRGASFDVRGEAPVARNVLQDSQHSRHHEIAGREAVAIEMGLERRLCTNSTAPGRRSFAQSSFA
jgi:hypothetical protein